LLSFQLHVDIVRPPAKAGLALCGHVCEGCDDRALCTSHTCAAALLLCVQRVIKACAAMQEMFVQP